MHTTLTTTVAVKLEHEVKERLQKLSQLKHRSAHWLMKQAIKSYLEQEEQNEQLKQETLERWQEAQSGKVVSQEAVSTWLDTWGTKDEISRPTCGS